MIVRLLTCLVKAGCRRTRVPNAQRNHPICRDRDGAVPQSGHIIRLPAIESGERSSEHMRECVASNACSKRVLNACGQGRQQDRTIIDDHCNLTWFVPSSGTFHVWCLCTILLRARALLRGWHDPIPAQMGMNNASEQGYAATANAKAFLFIRAKRFGQHSSIVRQPDGEQRQRLGGARIGREEGGMGGRGAVQRARSTPEGRRRPNSRARAPGGGSRWLWEWWQST